MIRSSSTFSRSMNSSPLRSKVKATEPALARLPPHFSNILRSSGTVRFLLSVSVST